MSGINQQNQVASVSGSDLVPVYSNQYGVTQNMAVTQLSNYIIEQVGGGQSLVAQYSSPNATGFSVSLENLPNVWLILTPISSYAAGTIVLPATPTHLQQFIVSSTQSVSTLTVNGNGKVVNGAPTSLTAGGTFAMRYDGVNQSWYLITDESGTVPYTAFGLDLITAANATAGRAVLLLGTSATGDIGAEVQGWAEVLDEIAIITPSDGVFIVGNGTAFVGESGSTARESLGLGTAATADTGDFATAAQGAKADSAAQLNVAQSYTAGQRGAIVALTDATNIAIDMALANFFSVTLGGNRTLDNPTNLVAGQSGAIFITQDATGSRTLAYGSFWDFAGGTAPTLSTTANTVDRLDYIVRTTGSIHAVLTKAWS